MKTHDVFYVVCDEEGIVNIDSKKYGVSKAVFDTYEAAHSVVSRRDDLPLHVEEVAIIAEDK